MYCSVEQSFRPDLRNRPVVVASNGDGVIVACNRRARELGIVKFNFVAHYQHLFDSGKCTLFSSNYRLYQEVSDRLIACLTKQQIFTSIAPYSIDELFGQLPSCITKYEDYLTLARRLRRAAWDEIKLPIGIGGGVTFTLSKAASFIGKKVEGYRGICVITDDNLELLSRVPVGDVWNVGKATAAILKRQGIYTALDLRRCSPDDGRSWGGVNLERTIRELRGEKVFSIDASFPDAESRKEVSSSISLTIRAESALELHQALSERIAIAAEKLRKLELTARSMVLFAQNSRFDREPQHFKTQVIYEYPVDDTRVLITSLSSNFSDLYKCGIRYYKIGCRLIGLEPTKHQQTDLFAPPQKPQLMQAVDALNKKFGYRAISVGSQRVDSQSKMLRNHLSPNYLSEWKDIPRIKC